MPSAQNLVYANQLRRNYRDFLVAALQRLYHERKPAWQTGSNEFAVTPNRYIGRPHMEPFHQLSVPMADVPDLDAELASIGFSAEHTDDSILVHHSAGFHTLICRRGDESAEYSYGIPDAAPDTHVLIYVNILDDPALTAIRDHLESRGAKWTYNRF